ncbi:MAG: hypothetical protein SFU87_01975 [Chitinophagaceae bacterium]|nr:hypothetical protein [Chitinophagaceae bacterium]
MMKIIILFGFLITSFSVTAQSLEEAEKFLYYGRLQSAEEVLMKIISGNPRDSKAYYLLCGAYLKSGKTSEAGEIARTGIQKTSAPLLSVAMGHVLLATEKKEEAARLFTKALEETKHKDAEILQAIAKAHIDAAQGDAGYAIELLGKIPGRHRKNPVVAILQGDAYLKLTEGGKAVSAYQLAVEYDKSDAEAFYKMGKIYLTQQNIQVYVPYFENAITADEKYAPAYLELYNYYYFRDINKAGDYLHKYIYHSDPVIEHKYMITDLLYASGKYSEALQKANEILSLEKENTSPRLYKLLAYSKASLKDSLKAKEFMDTYFSKQEETKVIAQDYSFYARLLRNSDRNNEQVINSLEKAIALDTLLNNKLEYMAELTDFYKKKEDKLNEAKWLGKIYGLKEKPSNVDLFNWGLALFLGGDYLQADSVFAIYTEKYPDQVYGHYWRARSNGVIDSTLETGTAVPHYEKLITLASADKEKHKNVLMQANSYLAMYAANVRKEFEKAIQYLQNILELDPANGDALKNREILYKAISKTETGNK